MEKDKDTLNRKTHSKEEEIKDKMKEIEDLKGIVRSKERDYVKVEREL